MVIAKAFSGLCGAALQELLSDIDVLRGTEGVLELLFRGLAEMALFALRGDKDFESWRWKSATSGQISVA